MIKYHSLKHYIPAYFVSFLAIIITTLPIIWIFLISIKSKNDSFTRPPKFFFEPIIDNYIKTINNEFFRETFFNSLLIKSDDSIISASITSNSPFKIEYADSIVVPL